MNELDQLTRFRDTVPVAVTRRARELFLAGLREDPHPERSVASRRNRLAQGRLGWRLGLAVSAAAALAAGILVAAQPSGELTVQLLADRASAAALAQPTVSPGQWVYRVVDSYRRGAPKGSPASSTEAGWETADGTLTYGHNWSRGAGGNLPSYSRLASLPGDPAALDRYLERTGNPVYPSLDPRVMSAFAQIRGMLSNYVLPPALEAEAYQALALLPGIQVESHVTAIDGQSGVAFMLPHTPHGDDAEIILNPYTYAYMAQADGLDGPGPGGFEVAVERMVIVAGPGSTRPSLTPPTRAELLAEQAYGALSSFTGTPLRTWVLPGSWILRDLATSSGDQEVWATADDSEQASYVNGRLRVCARSAACARSTSWLMPAGPPALPGSLPQLLTALNSYSTGCQDVAGDCNAVNAIASMDIAYLGSGRAPALSFLVLAGIPGVTVQQVTDVTGHADIAFRFPFTDGVTEILLNAGTRQFVGYARDGSQTVVTREEAVTGPGSLTPASPPSYDAGASPVYYPLGN
jgi:hypothetical protein